MNRPDCADVSVEHHGHVAIVQMQRPPNNFFDIELIRALADQFDALVAGGTTRAIVLAAQGKAFCAGADFSGNGDRDPAALYAQAIRLFRCPLPVVAAVHGPVIGGGVGLALAADFRVTCPSARFSVNFTRLGIHPGFGLSVTLPRLVGQQQAALLLYTGRRIDGAEAVRIGLADVLVDEVDAVRMAALSLAEDLAASAPLAVQDTRATLRQGLADAIAAAVEHECACQSRHFATADFREGVKAAGERRMPVFTGQQTGSAGGA